MGRKSLSDQDLYVDLVKTIKEKIKEQIDLEYTEMKLQYLDTIDYRLEAKRNEVVKSILDSMDITLSKSAMDIAPIIQIKIVKNNER